MTDQQFFNARDLGWHTIEHDTVDGAKRTVLFAGLWRTRFNLIANATLSPVKRVGMPDQLVRMTMRANATVVPA